MKVFRLMPVSARLLSGWAVLLAVMLYLNLHVVPGGIVSNAILDPDNPYQAADQQVKALPGLSRGDTLGLVVALPEGLNAKAVARIRQVSNDMIQLFPDAAVFSVTHNLTHYQQDDGSVQSAAYLPPNLSAAQLLEAQQLLRQQPLVTGMLLGHTGQGSQRQASYSQILVFLPEQFSEQLLVDGVAQYLEQRSITTLEWLLWKNDISPVAANADLQVSGWAIARGLMHYALISDVLWYCTLGLCLASAAAWVALGSVKQACICSLLIFASFVLTRGSIPLLDMLGLTIGSPAEPIRERVYFLLVLSALIVSGISLNVRALEAYNAEVERSGPSPQAWQALTPQLPRFNLVILIAALNFLGLSQIGIRGVLEVGLLSALGLGWQRLLVQYALPQLQQAWQALPPAAASRQAHWQQQVSRLLSAPGRHAVQFWLRRTPQQSLRQVMLGLGLLLAMVVAVLWHDSQVDVSQRLIQVREKPMDYLPGTIVDRARHQLNAPQATGFAQLSFYLAPSHVADARYPAVADREFLRQVDGLSQQLRQLAGVRAVVSVVDQLNVMQPLSQQSTATAYEHLQLIRWDLQQERLADSWWHNDGLVLWVSTPADDSVTLRAQADAVLALAAEQFPTLNILPFGTLHSYHQTDLYISERKPLNMLGTVPMVLLLAAAWFAWCHYQRQPNQAQPSRWYLKSWPAAAAICLPFIVAYALVVLVMALLQIPLDQATACATALGINAAIDFDVYLVEDYRTALQQQQSPDQALDYAFGQRSRLTLMDAGLNAICFSFLLFSSFIPMQRLGLIMLILLVICAFAAVCLLPAVLRRCTADSQGESR